MAELFGVPVSPGAVSGMVTRITARLDPALEAIRSAVAGAEVAHFDETGFRVAGKLAPIGLPALTPVHELKRPAGQRMEPMRHPHPIRMLLSTRTTRSRQRDRTTEPSATSAWPS